MTKNISLEERLADWGKKNKQLPKNNEILKQKVLAAVRPAFDASVERPNRIPLFFYRLGIVAAATAAIVLTVNNPEIFTNRIKERGHAIPTDGIVVEDLGLSYGAATGLGRETLTQKIVNAVMPASEKADVVTYDAALYSNNIETVSLPLDTREFLDTRYYATINTRDVQKVSTQTKTIIRGHGGRIDNLSEQPKTARISFSLPKDELDSIIIELKDLAPEKLFLETTYAANRLGEKQNIESDTDKTITELDRLQDEREKLTDLHEKQATVAQNKINSLVNSLNYNYKLKSATTSTTRIAELNAEIARLSAAKKTAEAELKTLNNNYKNDLARINRDIERQGSTLENLGERDDKLIAEVETVTGTITIQWISVWGIINTYVPTRPIIIILIIIGALYLLFKRRPRPLYIPE